MHTKKKRELRMITSHCAWCGRMFAPHHNAKNPLYCSTNCKQKMWRANEKVRKQRALSLVTEPENEVWQGLVRYCGNYIEVDAAIRAIWQRCEPKDRLNTLELIRYIVECAVSVHKP